MDLLNAALVITLIILTLLLIEMVNNINDRIVKENNCKCDNVTTNNAKETKIIYVTQQNPRIGNSNSNTNSNRVSEVE